MSFMKQLFICITVILKFFQILVYFVLPKKGKFFTKLRLKLENRIVFSPRIKKVYPICPELLGKFEVLKLITTDLVKLHAWFIEPDEKKPIVVFCHGQSENISKWQNVATFLKSNGFGALFLSYRGHYKSAGLPSEAGIYEDARCAISFLVERGYKSQDIIFWGRSLGSSIACEMALSYSFKAVILESPIYNIHYAAVTMANMYMNRVGLGFLSDVVCRFVSKMQFLQKFDNAAKISAIKSPILIMHSKNDIKIPYHVSEQLAALNPTSSLYLCEDGSHNTNDWCLDKVKDFIENLDESTRIFKMTEKFFR